MKETINLYKNFNYLQNKSTSGKLIVANFKTAKDITGHWGKNKTRIMLITEKKCSFTLVKEMQIETYCHFCWPDKKQKALERAEELSTLRHPRWGWRWGQPGARLSSTHLTKFKRHILLTGISPTDTVTRLYKDVGAGNSPVVQWLGLRAFTAQGLGSIPVWGTKIPTGHHLVQPEKKKGVHCSIVYNSQTLETF